MYIFVQRRGTKEENLFALLVARSVPRRRITLVMSGICRRGGLIDTYLRIQILGRLLITCGTLVISRGRAGIARQTQRKSLVLVSP
jgi:hypothetical protein